MNMLTTENHVTAAVGHAERTPDPCIVVIFGASGDLTKRKLLPALYHLEQSGLLPEDFAVVGVARRPLENTFAADMKEGIISGGGVEKDDPKLDPFVNRIQYHAMNFDDAAGYDALKTVLADMDTKYGTKGNRLFLRRRRSTFPTSLNIWAITAWPDRQIAATARTGFASSLRSRLAMI
jgi:glucose-6-phosphate 1-dehydrogenase